MLPCKITIRNIGPYESLSVDLESIPGAVVGVTGRTGEGKTFLLECMFAALYRTLPTRPAGIYKSCTARHCGIEFEWRTNGSRYRSLLAIDSQAQKMEAVLERDGVVLNDGKVRSYDPLIESILGGEREALISNFAAQDKTGSFTEIDKADRKALFIKMLGLERLQLISEEAGKCADLIQRSIDGMEGSRPMLLAAAGAVPPNLTELEDGRQQTISLIAEAIRKIEETTGALAELKAKCAGAEGLVEQRVALQARLDKHRNRACELESKIRLLETELGSLEQLKTRLPALKIRQRDLDHELSLATDKLAKISARTSRIGELRARKTSLESRVASLNQDLTNVSVLIKSTEALIAVLPRLIEGKAGLERDKLERVRLASENLHFRNEHANLLRSAQSVSEAARELESTLSTHTISEREIRQKLASALDDAKILGCDSGMVADGVPCRGAGEFAECKLLVRAVESTRTVDVLNSAADNAVAAGLAVKREIEALPKISREAIANVEKMISSGEKALRALDDKIASIEASLRDFGKAEEAGHRIDLLREQKKSIEQSLAIADVDLEVAVAELSECNQAIQEQTLLESAKREIVNSLEKAKAEISDLQERILRIEADAAKTAGLQEQLQTENSAAESVREEVFRVDSLLAEIDKAGLLVSSITQEIASIAANRDTLTAQAGEFEGKIALAKDQIQSIESAKRKLQELDLKLRPMMDDVAAYRIIQKAFGPMEIQSFEIEAAGPGISEIANNLLFNCFGPRFSVKFVTRTLKADGTGFKDDFDVIIRDEEKGREGPIDGYSGGQKVINGEAIRLAIALYNREKNNVTWDTLFRDEASSALDDGLVPQYISMLKSAREIGHFVKLYFVSHQGRAKELADSKIMIENGTATIET